MPHKVLTLVEVTHLVDRTERWSVAIDASVEALNRDVKRIAGRLEEAERRLTNAERG